ncbi:MAG: NUDIX domain-containing protein [Anaerolineae bacterium]|nr:NUDIX domain-containing protein [Anaerolineae bacterium]NIN97420.1 NUDIX domain-containing protein [Anaerolineae bacterium]NIQ80352.1 NUDIX domain-containing protein [Anaerolineae bacterium]
MKPGEIRPIVVCVFRDDDRIFVGEYSDPSTGETFYRPLGGAIRFGELSRESITRELREEMGAEVKNVRYVGVLENIFTYDGKPGHEIVLVYEASFADVELYNIESIACCDDDGEFVASWKSLADFRAGKDILYPEGLLDLLDRQAP